MNIAGSPTRPVTTTSAPCANASTIGPGTQIGVGRNDGVAQVPRAAGPVDQRPIVAPDEIGHVVAGHRRDAQTAQPGLPRDLRDQARRRHRIGRAHIGDHPNTAGAAGGQHALHPLAEQRVEPGRRVTRALALGDGDGALGQALEHQVIERAVLRQFQRRLDPVARVAGAGADPERAHSGKIPNATAANVITTEQSNSNGMLKR